MNILLLIHPVAQLAAVALALYVAYLGFQRTRSLHFKAATSFKRDLHAGLGALALLGMLVGIAGGLIMVSRVLDKSPLHSPHGIGGMVLLPFLLFGIFSGFFLYMSPPKGKLLSALHGINNLIILLLAIFQLASGFLFLMSLLAAG